MSESSGESAPGQPGATPFARWLDSVVPAIFRSDAELARAVGVARSAVSRWRRGTVPQVPALLKLAAATGVSTDYLLRVAGYTAPDAAGTESAR